MQPARIAIRKIATTDLANKRVRGKKQSRAATSLTGEVAWVTDFAAGVLVN